MANPVFSWIKQRWRLLSVLLIPLVLLPLPVVSPTSEARCGYIVMILIILWVFEILPLPITSLLPLILFPTAGILDPETVSQSYFKSIVALFFGSLSVACAIESVNLHRRVALLVLSSVGTSAARAMAGLMGVTAFLSMWINNTAATSIMMPVALAISDELEQHGRDFHDRSEAIRQATSAVNEALEITETEVPDGHTTKEIILDTFRIEEPKPEKAIEVKRRFRFPFRRENHIQVVRPQQKTYEEMKKAFLLATAYSATIGGLSSLVGTAPNILVKAFVESRYHGTGFRITFVNFLLLALPVAVIMLVLCWLWLQIFFNRKEFFRCRSDERAQEVKMKLKAMLGKQYSDLAKPSWSEITVCIVFLLMVVLWLTREFGDTPGWNSLFREDYVEDSTVAVFCGVLLLILPNANPFRRDWKYEPIVTWSALVKYVAWDAIFLLGAGLSMASAFTESGLSAWVAQRLKFLAGVPRAAVILIIIVISALFTEVTSNTSTANIFFPVLDAVARSSGMHPGYLILPCTLAVSLAFMLPIATPPNAIVFGSGALRVIDMVKTGVVMNLLGFVAIFLAAMTWMPKIYNLNDASTSVLLQLNSTVAMTTVKTIG